MIFKIDHKDKNSSARSGFITTDHGKIQTPIFMPVGTLGTVKGLDQEVLQDPVGAEIVLGNTYHLYLRPGLEILESAGGLHNFINWPLPLLTDSGGYQVYSLSNRRKITTEGVSFSSHIDGSNHFFSPERAVDIQRSIGADIIMAFDECTPYPCDYAYAKKSMALTHGWLHRCVDHFNKQSPKYQHRQILAPIVQGSIYRDLRKASAKIICDVNAPLNAIGGLSVGEPAEDMYLMTEDVCAILPVEKPRYLMGVGTPENILNCIALGVDMFDCVLPTRNARHGLIYTTQGLMNIKNKKWASCHEPIDADIPCSSSQKYSKAYLRHLIISKELLGARLASLQNLTFYMHMIKQAREKIKEGTFLTWKNAFIKRAMLRI
jgi:queuine tRNA-ribosyltransferase